MQDQLLGAIETLYDCVGDDYDRPRAIKRYSGLVDDSTVILADMNIQQRLASRIDTYNIPGEAGQIFTTQL